MERADEKASSERGRPVAASLSDYIREHQKEILIEWERSVRALPVARDLDRLSLLDHIPDLLERIAAMAGARAAGGIPALTKEVAEQHALERLDEGFDLSQVVVEFSILRDCIVRLWESQPFSSGDLAELRVLHKAIDKAVSESVERYTQARDRTLQALDRVSAAALEARTLDEFLARLLRVLLDTTAAVDTVSILLRHGELLVVRASVGLEAEVDSGWFVRMGEGFAGLIAATRKPHSTSSAATDPAVQCPGLRAKGVKALYGVPLVDAGQVLGVAEMGSLTAREFSQQDKRLLAVMANRATAAIFQHLLRETAERHARQQEALATFSQRVPAIGEVRALLDEAVRVVVTTLNVEFAAVLRRETAAELIFEAVFGWDAELAGTARVPATETSEAGYTLVTRRSVIVEDVQTDTRFQFPEYFRERRIRSGMSAPVVVPGQSRAVCGVLSVHALRPRAFSADDVHFLEGIASALATTIALQKSEQERARLLAQAQQDRAEVEALLSSSLVGFGFIDKELRYVRVNAALAAMNGLAPAAHAGRTVREVLGQSADIFESLLRRVLTTGEAVSNLEFTAAPAAPQRGEHSFLANYFPVRTPDGDTLGVGAAVLDITARKRTEKELLEQQAQFRTLADNIAQLAWMADESGSIFWYNRRWFEYTGTTHEEMLGWGWQKVHHPDHVQRVFEKLRDHFENGKTWEDTFPLKGRDGCYRWFLSRAIPIRDERGNVIRWFGTNTDVTEQRLLTEVTSVLSSSSDYRETLEKMAELLVPALADWCFVDLLEREQSVTRLAVVHADPAKVALAKDFRRRYPPEWNAPAGSTKVIRTGAPELVEEVSAELLASHVRDPELLKLLLTLGFKSYILVPLAARGRTLGTIGIISAESGRRYERRDLDFLQELARRAAIVVDNARLYEEAQRAVRMREEVLAVVSHDLRNPLGAIQMAGALLLRKPALDGRSRKHVETIIRSAARMEHLIGDLLDMASIQAGRLAVDRKPEDAASIVAEAVDIHEPAAKEKGVTIVRHSAAAGLLLLVDRDRILQLFGNLLGNAIKFCRAGDVITVRAELSGGEARLAIADTGPGIPEQELPHIFERYWSAKRHARKGTGLGLFISKGIVEAHGGRLWAESKPSGGATFSFTLPLAGADGVKTPAA